MKVTYGYVTWGDPYSEFMLCIYPSKVHTPGAVGIYAAVPGEQLGVQCFAQGHLSRGIEGEESATFTPPPTIPAGPRLELATFRL